MRKFSAAVPLQHRLAGAGPGLPLSADRHPRHLFLQRLAAGDGVGRLVAALVSRVLQRPRHDRGGLDEPAGRALLGDASRPLLGTLAAVALSRGERFRGRTLFSGMLYAPLVMPEVITGLSLLLLFVALNAERGFWTVTIAHTTLTMCFVAVVVQSRLGSLDRSLEEAAMDLGCAPVRAFLTVTLPLIAPAIVAGLDARLHAVARRSRDRELHHRPGLGDAADPDLFGGAAWRKARDQRDLHAGDRADRGGHRHRLACLETVELAGRERSAAL